MSLITNTNLILKNLDLKATGINLKNNLVEIIEILNHPWFVGVQFHPEYKSTVQILTLLFVGFIKMYRK